MKKFNYVMNKPLSNIYPKGWLEKLGADNTFVAEYPNLQYFKHHIKTITQKKDDQCGISYADALDEFVKSVPTMTESEYDVIKNRVKNNLLKRGLISEKIYESYKYVVDGEILDVGKFVADDPECYLTPNEKYTSFFYELYISVSYPWDIADSTIVENMAKILATVELLEREHIYCKISLVLPNTSVNDGDGPSNYLGIIPLFAHDEVKSVEVMSSVLNERLLRKFFFAIWETTYGEDLARGHGLATDLPHCIKPVNLDECELAANILEQIIVPEE